MIVNFHDLIFYEVSTVYLFTIKTKLESVQQRNLEGLHQYHASWAIGTGLLRLDIKKDGDVSARCVI